MRARAEAEEIVRLAQSLQHISTQVSSPPQPTSLLCGDLQPQMDMFSNTFEGENTEFQDDIAEDTTYTSTNQNQRAEVSFVPGPTLNPTLVDTYSSESVPSVLSPSMKNQFANWEQYTKGFGSRMLRKMGYVMVISNTYSV